MTNSETSNIPVCWNCINANIEGTDRSTKVAPPRKTGKCSAATAGKFIMVEGQLEEIETKIDHSITSQTPCNIYTDPVGETPAFVAR